MSRVPWLRPSDQVALAVLTFGFLLSLALYAHLPARVPTHFDLDGEPNGWSSRFVGAFLLPTLAIGAWALTRWSSSIVWARVHRTNAAPTAPRVLAPFAAAVVVCLVALHALVLAAATEGRLAPRGHALVIAGICLACSIAFPRLRRNAFVGVRTPWSRATDEIWARTHRLASSTFFAAFLVSLAVAATRAGASAAVAALLVAGLVPAVASAFFARAGSAR